MLPFILAQIFGLLGSIAMLLSNWQKTRNKVLTLLILDSICYFIQYILLGALSGAFTNVIGLIRTIIFKYKDKYKVLDNKIILFIILLIYLIVGIITYDGIISTLPVIAAIIYTSVLWQDNLKIIRIGTFIMILACFIYNIAVEAYTGAVVEGILLISSVLAIIKLDILNEHHRKKSNIILKKLTNH